MQIIKYLCLFSYILVYTSLTCAEAKDNVFDPKINIDSTSIYHKAYIISELLYNRAKGTYAFTKDENKIYPNLVGKIYLNNNINSVYKNFSKKNIYKVIVLNEVKRDRYIDINLNNGSNSIRISPKCDNASNTNCIIDKITITDPAFSVYDSGLCVGMTLDDLILLYGDSLQLLWKDFYLTVKVDSGIYFILDTEQIPKSWFIKKNSTLSNLPIKTKIKAIYLTST